MDDNAKVARPKMPPIEHMRSAAAQKIAEAAIEVTTLVERRGDIRASLSRAEDQAERMRRELADVNLLLDAARKALAEATDEAS
jgi:hypothetical protein